MSDNKYKIFRNFMVNELGISRDDIKEWTIQAVSETVDKILRQYNIKKFVHDAADSAIRYNKTLYGFDKEAVSKAIYEIVKSKLKVHLELKEEKTEEAINA